jgi:hypothetical protein
MNLIEYYLKSHKFIPVEDVYPDYIGNFSYGPYDYIPLLESFRVPIAIIVEQNDYQGDSWVLFHNPKNNRFGYLCFGWGSCSGCDALQGCTSTEELRDLQQNLYNDVIWFNSINEVNQFFNTHDWEGDYAWSYEEFKQFIDTSKAYISNLSKGANL